jgi:hypothetical protein
MKKEAEGLNTNGAMDIKKNFILKAFNYAASDINVESLYKHSHYKDIQVKTENKSNELLG